MRRPHVRPTQERQAPFFVGIDVGTRTHDAAVVDANGMACLPTTLKFANTREGATQGQAASTDATAQASPSEIPIGGEATGPYWLSLYEVLTHAGYRVLVLHPRYVKARCGTTLRGTKTASVDALLLATILRQEDVPRSPIPEGSRTCTLRVIPPPSKPGKMPLNHIMMKGHCDASASRLLPTGRCRMPLARPDAALYLAQPTCHLPAAANGTRTGQVETSTYGRAHTLCGAHPAPTLRGM